MSQVTGEDSLARELTSFGRFQQALEIRRIFGKHAPILAIETEGVTTGSNATPATAQDINGSFLSVKTPLTRAQRGAVLGTTENSFDYVANSVAPSFIDISSTGNRSTNAVQFDGTDTLDATQLGGFTFKFFGTTYDSLSFSTNGLISFGVADPNNFNSDLSTSPAEAVVAPYWTEMDNLDTGVAPEGRASSGRRSVRARTNN